MTIQLEDEPTAALVNEAQKRLSAQIVAAGLFVPNAGYFGGGPLFGALTLVAEARAMRSGSLSKYALWVRTPECLHIFSVDFRLLGLRFKLSERLGTWKLDTITAHQVRERGKMVDEEDFAIAFQDSSNRYIEMKALAHNRDSRSFIESLVGEPLKVFPK
jgi:hypothetical protein